MPFDADGWSHFVCKGDPSVTFSVTADTGEMLSYDNPFVFSLF